MKLSIMAASVTRKRSIESPNDNLERLLSLSVDSL